MTRLLAVVALCVLTCVAVCCADDQPVSPVAEALVDFAVPPAWVADVEVTYDMNTPWQDARRDVRALLAQGGEFARQAMKLTWLYKQKGDIGDGSEYALNMFFGGDPLWALANYADLLNTRIADGNTKGLVWPAMNYASCCNHFKDHALALTALNMAYGFLPDPPNDQMALAKLEEALGDTCALMGDASAAAEHFAKAAEIYPQLQQTWIVKRLDDHLARLQAKMAMASMESLELAGLTDGVYSGSMWGYEDYLKATVTVAEGQVTDINIEHRDSLPQTAPVWIPQQVIEKQSLAVDTVTGATITSQAVINAIFRALSQAGLQ